jgi:hypothetical protein
MPPPHPLAAEGRLSTKGQIRPWHDWIKEPIPTEHTLHLAIPKTRKLKQAAGSRPRHSQAPARPVARRPVQECGTLNTHCRPACSWSRPALCDGEGETPGVCVCARVRVCLRDEHCARAGIARPALQARPFRVKHPIRVMRACVLLRQTWPAVATQSCPACRVTSPWYRDQARRTCQTPAHVTDHASGQPWHGPSARP